MSQITFLERYLQENRWSNKVHIMEIFHLSHSHHDKTWTITRTAAYFGVSVALVSENLKIAKASHTDEKILACRTREEALKKVNHAR